ncbi:MAG: D-2-hydroxyacid dehydrogenase [Candidatus Solibacter usitatus]|nr:D-2-hydroxyacid dehydrogenase [Candidatus Solibacter usitatus]
MLLSLLLAGLAAGSLSAQEPKPAPKKILVTGRGISYIPDMKILAPNVTFVEAKADGMIAQIADADAFLGEITPPLFQAAKKLKWVHIYSAGVERSRFPEFINSNVALTNGKIIQGPEIADHAFALLLSLTRNIVQAIPNRAKEEWPKSDWKAIELRGKTALIIGVGGIGSQIATRAAAFGMTVIGVDPKDVPFHPAISQVVPPDRIDSVIPKADVVFVSAPHTPQSEKMVGAKQFDLMKRGAYFIAVSRGKLYDTNALVKALDSKRIAGAGLDVTDPEPLPKGHALWKFDNVVLTPHIATVSDGVGERYRELVLDNVARFAKGEPLRNVVDKVKGY